MNTGKKVKEEIAEPRINLIKPGVPEDEQPYTQTLWISDKTKDKIKEGCDLSGYGQNDVIGLAMDLFIIEARGQKEKAKKSA